MRPPYWNPPIELSEAEQVIISGIKKAKLFIFLRHNRHHLFNEEFQTTLATMFKDSTVGQCPVPPALLALALILQAYTGVSDDEVIEALVMDRRWQLVLDCHDCQKPPFSKGTLVNFRQAMIEFEVDQKLIERTVEIAKQQGGFGSSNLKAALDSSPLWGAAKVEDTYNLLGHASRSQRFDGYKRHVLKDLEIGVVRSVGLTSANIPEAQVTEAMDADLKAQNVKLVELHIDRAYLPSHWVKQRSEDLTIFCKAWPVRNGDRFTKTDFVLDWERSLISCPNNVTIPFEQGKTVHFPASECHVCPISERCTTSAKGRSVSIHPDEAFMQELRQRQDTELGRAKLRERSRVEHTLAHLGQWQGDRARYLGARKNLFDLRRVAVIHNLHVIARMPAPAFSQQVS